MKEANLAIDFGGGSGRVIAGYVSDGKTCLDKIYRDISFSEQAGKDGWPYILGFPFSF